MANKIGFVSESLTKTFVARVYTENGTKVGADIAIDHRGNGIYRTDALTLPGTTAAPIQYIFTIWEGATLTGVREGLWNGAGFASESDTALSANSNLGKVAGGPQLQTSIYQALGILLGADQDKLRTDLSGNIQP